MFGRSTACPIVLVVASFALSCRGPTSPRASIPVVLVAADETSALQARLATIAPTTVAPENDVSRRLTASLDAFFARTRGHRGYIAVDKPLYQPGETVWFRLFELASADLGAKDRALATCKLIDPRGATVVEKRVIVDAGGGGNDIMLPADMPGGEYVLQATTDRGTKTERRVIVAAYEAPRIKKKLEFVRKAYGPGDRVMATLALHRATGEPLANRQVSGLITLDGTDLPRVPVTTDAAGNATVTFELPAKIARGDGLLTVLVGDGGVTESVQKRVPITLKDLGLALYPEGGDLVAGLPGRVYFAATNPLGKPADIEGRVVDENGAVVALLRSFHDGMGRFEIVPGTGSYKVEITRPVGIARTYELPRAKSGGCTLQSLDDAPSARSDLRVAVWCTEARQVVVAGVLREKRVATAGAQVSASEPAVVALAMPAGVQGAVRVTLFDSALSPLAERLIYRNRGADLKVTITPDRATYTPRDKVTLTIDTKGPDGKPVASDLALSVVDDTVLAFADDKQATLLARLYLEAEMPGQKIEEPNFYFGKDPKAAVALDLVLGTHGWRRFDWKPVLSAPPPPPIEEAWTFTGEYWSKPDKKKVVKPAGANDPAGVEPGQVAVAKPAREQAAPAAANRKGDVIQIEGAAPVIDPGSTKTGITITDDFTRNIPAGRTFGGVLGGAAGEMIQISGSTSLENIYIIDDGTFDIGSEAAAHRIVIRRGGQEDGLAGGYIEDPYASAVPEREFPRPSYDVRYDGPRTDFRETLLWQSRLRTDASGKAETTFYLSDAVTSFEVTAEGVGNGAIGRGEAQVQSKKPVSLAVKLPLEVSSGDHIRLPVTIANETTERYTATLAATFGKAFAMRGGALAPELELAPGERKATFYELDVVGDGTDAAAGAVAIAVEASNLTDSIERTIRVVPRGFPQDVSVAGTLERSARHEILVSDVVPGSMRGKVAFYPSPLATMMKGSEAMIAEPGGCFEQATSTNYPNVMILSYLEDNGAADPALVEKTQGVLARGYKLLAGYESKTHGYEWFGGDPGHEALTAFGLMEFRDMAKVFPDVDKAMIERTRKWLRDRRDGSGGYRKNEHTLHVWAGDEITDAYIAYALADSGETDLGPELAKQRANAAATKDPYLMALATNALVKREPRAATTKAALAKLAAMQAADGSFPGADHSVVMSGGQALAIETTAFAALALLAGDRPGEARRAVQWLDAHRSGNGNYGSTQATVLALKVMGAYAKEARRTESAGSITLVVNGKRVDEVTYEKGHQGAIELDIGKHLRPGKNVVELSHEGGPLPYASVIGWTSTVPATDPATKVRLATALAKPKVALGEGVRMNVEVTNTTDKGVPMTLARIGLPGGLTFQTWQLQELRDKKTIDFYETRQREVIVYFRELGAHETRTIPLDLMATVPGTFVAPASRAYLYYTDEHKHWVAPSMVTIVP